MKSEQRLDYLELLAKLFVVLFVFPALTMLIVTVMSVLAPRLSANVSTPVGLVTIRQELVYSSVTFVLGVGLGVGRRQVATESTRHPELRATQRAGRRRPVRDD